LIWALALATASLLAPEPVARAQTTPEPTLTLDITTSFNNNVIYGGGATYRVSAPPPPWQPAGSVTWRYRQLDTVSGIASGWRVYTGGLSWDTIERTPGSFEMEASVPLWIRPDPTHPAQRATPIAKRMVTVLPPDRIALPTPVTVPWTRFPLNGDIFGYRAGVITFGFPVTCSGFTPNALPNATLLEDILDMSWFGRPYRNRRNLKITEGGISGTTLMDQKSCEVTRNFGREFARISVSNSYGPGFVFLIYRQTLKLRIPDYNGDQKIFPLGPTFTFKQSSTAGNLSPTTFEIK